ncbi:MAG: GNAT family N-acetyltransferase [Anaerolineales bacterium]
MADLKNLFPNPTVCRPALPMDTPGMLELTRHIWEGEDYVPYTWDAWMADYEGLLAVAEYKARVVGLGKVTKLSESDWWLEGLRVHPEFEGRGIASKINDYLLDFWQRNGSGIIRLATISKREPVKHMVKKRGFNLIGEYETYEVQFRPSRDPTTHSTEFQPVNPAEINEALSWLAAPGKIRLDFGIMDLGWQFAPPRQEFIEDYVKREKIWWWQNQQGLLVMVPKTSGDEPWARIRMLACDREHYLTCLLDAHSFAEEIGYEGATWKAPNLPEFKKVLTQAGFIQEKDYTLQIYEKSFNGD